MTELAVHVDLHVVLKSHKKEVETVHVANRIKCIPAHVASCDTFLATVYVDLVDY